MHTTVCLRCDLTTMWWWVWNVAAAAEVERVGTALAAAQHWKISVKSPSNRGKDCPQKTQTIWNHTFQISAKIISKIACVNGTWANNFNLQSKMLNILTFDGKNHNHCIMHLRVYGNVLSFWRIMQTLCSTLSKGILLRFVLVCIIVFSRLACS